MNTVRSIHDGLREPSGTTYLLVALLSALAVFVVAGRMAAAGAQGELQTGIVHYVDRGGYSAGIATVSTRDQNESGSSVTPVVVVDGRTGTIDPSRIVVPAGVAFEVEFTGTGVGPVSIEGVLTGERPTSSGVAVSVPPLAEGVYEYTCGDGAQTGLLVAR